MKEIKYLTLHNFILLCLWELLCFHFTVLRFRFQNRNKLLFPFRFRLFNKLRSGSGSASQKVTVPTVPVPQHWCPVAICKLLEVLSFQYVNQFLPYLFVTGSSVKMVCFFSVADPHSFYAGPFTKKNVGSATLFLFFLFFWLVSFTSHVLLFVS
jgi:hypothetical protein